MRPEGIRLNGDRLREEIRAKGLTQKDFGLECNPLMLELGLWKVQRTEKQAGDWVCKLCRPDGDPKKAGVHPALLSWICRFFGVRHEYLAGMDDYRTEEDVIIAALKKAEEITEKRNKAKSRQLMRRYEEFMSSPVFTLIRDRVAEGSLLATSFAFENDPDTFYEIDSTTLRMIETACADLCCSLIRSNAVSWTVKE